MNIFEQYDNPRRALKVWKSYEEDMTDEWKIRRAQTILAECNSADTLDARLDLLLGKVLHFAGNDARLP